MDIFEDVPDEEYFKKVAGRMEPTEEAYYWFQQPEQENLRQYVEDLASRAGELGPWIKQIYPALWFQYLKSMDPDIETDEVQKFSSALLQYLHQ